MIRFAPHLPAALGLSTAVLLAAACKTGENGVGDVLVVARVEVTPPSSTLTPQETVTLVATPGPHRRSHPGDGTGAGARPGPRP